MASDPRTAPSNHKWAALVVAFTLIFAASLALAIAALTGSWNSSVLIVQPNRTTAMTWASPQAILNGRHVTGTPEFVGNRALFCPVHRPGSPDSTCLPVTEVIYSGQLIFPPTAAGCKMIPWIPNCYVFQ
jgi:hypothetical protein